MSFDNRLKYKKQQKDLYEKQYYNKNIKDDNTVRTYRQDAQEIYKSANNYPEKESIKQRNYKKKNQQTYRYLPQNHQKNKSFKSKYVYLVPQEGPLKKRTDYIVQKQDEQHLMKYKIKRSQMEHNISNSNYQEMNNFSKSHKQFDKKNQIKSKQNQLSYNYTNQSVATQPLKKDANKKRIEQLCVKLGLKNKLSRNIIPLQVIEQKINENELCERLKQKDQNIKYLEQKIQEKDETIKKMQEQMESKIEEINKLQNLVLQFRHLFKGIVGEDEQ